MAFVLVPAVSPFIFHYWSFHLFLPFFQTFLNFLFRLIFFFNGLFSIFSPVIHVFRIHIQWIYMNHPLLIVIIWPIVHRIWFMHSIRLARSWINVPVPPNVNGQLMAANGARPLSAIRKLLSPGMLTIFFFILIQNCHNKFWSILFISYLIFTKFFSRIISKQLYWSTINFCRKINLIWFNYWFGSILFFLHLLIFHCWSIWLDSFNPVLTETNFNRIFFSSSANSHADGSLKFWDASAVNLQILYKLKTAKLFEKPRLLSSTSQQSSNSSQQPQTTNNNSQNNSNKDTETGNNANIKSVETEDHFAIEYLTFSAENRILCVAGASSQVIVFRFNKQEAQSEITVRISSGENLNLNFIFFSPLNIYFSFLFHNLSFMSFRS